MASDEAASARDDSSSAAPVIVITTTGASEKQVLERRVAWLEEDLGVKYQQAGATIADAEGRDEGEERLKVLAQHLLSELEHERRWRDELDLSLTRIEASLRKERADREQALWSLSAELEESMTDLVTRIDNGLNEGTQSLKSRAERTEAALRGLISRLEDGLETGAKALQETLMQEGIGPDLLGLLGPATAAAAAAPPIAPIMPSLGKRGGPDAPPADWATGRLLNNFMANLPRVPETASPTASSRLPPGGTGGGTPGRRSLQPPVARLGQGREEEAVPSPFPMPSTESDTGEMTGATGPLLKVWQELQEENMRLRKRRQQLYEKRSSRTGSRSPTGQGLPYSSRGLPGRRLAASGTASRASREGSMERDRLSDTTPNSLLSRALRGSSLEATTSPLGNKKMIINFADNLGPPSSGVTPTNAGPSPGGRSFEGAAGPRHDIDNMSTTSSLPSSSLHDGAAGLLPPQPRQPLAWRNSGHATPVGRQQGAMASARIPPKPSSANRVLSPPSSLNSTSTQPPAPSLLGRSGPQGQGFTAEPLRPLQPRV